MTDREIMAMSHEDMVRLFLLRRDDLKAASKEAARIARNERHRNDPEYQAYHAEYQRNWSKANREHIQEYRRHWHEKNREKENEYWREWRRKKALEKQPAVTAAVAVTVGPPAIIPQASETPKVVIPRVKVVVSELPDPDEPRRRTDKETAAYWQQVLDDLECQFDGGEIDVEAYYNRRNVATNHLLAAEARMKSKRVRNY